MTAYELSNNQRRYFGLLPVAESWERRSLSDTIAVYFERNKIVKVLDYSFGYQEYDCEIDTKERQILFPKTSRGKEHKLTIPKILKIKGAGVQFSGSFKGGGIHVYDHRGNLFFIRSYFEERSIQNYQDIHEWVSNYISSRPSDYFEWLNDQISQKRMCVQAKEGDIIAFKISQTEYGFARILLDIFKEGKKPGPLRPELLWIHPRSFLVTPYAYYSDTLNINLDDLVLKMKMPSICILDLGVYRGEMPVIGFRTLPEADRQILFPQKSDSSVAICYTKTDIETFITSRAINKD
jgi:Immunity protein 26